MPNDIEVLESWYQQKRASGEVLDIKFAPVSQETSMSTMAKAVFETVTGQRRVELLDTKQLDIKVGAFPFNG